MSGHQSSNGVNPILQPLVAAFAGTDVAHDDDVVEFFADELYVIANLVEVTQRIRIRVYLHTDEERVVQDWVEAQPAPRSGLIQSAYLDDDDKDWRPSSSSAPNR